MFRTLNEALYLKVFEVSVAATDAVAAAVLVQDEDLTGREPALKYEKRVIG